MRRRHRRCLAAVLTALALGGCDPQDAGYVQVQLGRTGIFRQPALFLDGTRLDFARGHSVVLRFRTGQVSLRTSRSAWGSAICRVVVRKNRITVLSVAATEDPPRCLCQIHAAESTPAETICT